MEILTSLYGSRILENTFEIKVVSKTYNCFYQRWDLERQRSGGYEKYAEHGYKTCVHSRK